jgi:BASS family bile acid:Na+ symporter
LIFAKIAPVLILPFILAVSIQKFSPTLNTKILKLQFISFYLWALALTVVIAKIINFILNQQGISLWFMIGAGILALIICIIQFALGKYIGNRYGDKVAGGQSLGQKNTVLAIWMSQTYLNPISSIIPAIYVILQNVYNSYQLWKQDTNHRKQHG